METGSAHGPASRDYVSIPTIRVGHRGYVQQYQCAEELSLTVEGEAVSATGSERILRRFFEDFAQFQKFLKI